MRAWIGDARGAKGPDYGNSSETENHKCHDQNRQHGHLDVVRFNLFAQVLRSSPDHQSGDEHSEHHKYEHPVETRTDTADNDFAKLDIKQRNESAQRREVASLLTQEPDIDHLWGRTAPTPGQDGLAAVRS